MHGLNPGTWESFALGQVGASAALFGLLFVGISINLRDVLSSRTLVNRAAEAVLLLGGILVAATAVLVPRQTRQVVGIELAVVGVVVLLSVVALQRERPSAEGGPPAATPALDAPVPTSARVLRRVLSIGACVLVLVAAASLLAGFGGGLYWWAGAVVLAYVSALTSAWVLLVEILR